MDDETRLDPRELSGEDRYGEALVYDSAKFLTTLSLLALGGVLTLTEAADGNDIKVANIIGIMVAISGAAAVGSSTVLSVAFSRSANKPVSRFIHYYLVAAAFLLSIGLGMFLMMWLDTLD